MERAATPVAVLAAEAAMPDTGEFEALVRQHWPSVFRFTLGCLRDRDAAESLTQDCFLKAYQARDRFRGECSFHTWVMQIAVNLVRDYARNRRLQFWKRTRTTAIDVTEAGPWLADGSASLEQQVAAREELEAVWEAVAGLSERQRTVFLLRFVEDMELLDIVAATGMKEGTVKVHLFRAVHAIRERLGRRK